jgi:hypothetical protein
MFDWVELAVLLLKAANGLISMQRDRGFVSQGQDMEIAKQSAAILTRSNAAKAVMQDMTSLTEQQTDDVLKQLGET